VFYRKLIEACGECKQREEALKLFQDLKKNSLELSIETFNAYFQACSESSYNTTQHTTKPPPEISKKHQSKLMNMLQKAVIELNIKCPNVECNNYLREEEIITNYPKNLDTYQTMCSVCEKQFIPNLDVYLSKNKIKQYMFLSPHLFSKETNNLINNAKSSTIFFTVFVVIICRKDSINPIK